MNYFFNKNDLNYFLDTVEKALPTRSNIAVIGNILMELDGSDLIFTSTNLEFDIQVKSGYKSENIGKILLPAKIVDIVRHLPSSEVEMNVDWDTFRVELRSGSANFSLFGANPEDYPVIKTNKGGEQILSVDQVFFKQVLKSVIFAASNDESKPAFNGVLFSFQERRLTMTASDTYRLVTKEIEEDKWAFQEQRYLIPAKSLRELLKVMGDDGRVIVSPIQRRLFFIFGDVCFATHVLEEKFPDVSSVIPTQYKTRVVIDRKSFEDTMGRAALLAEGINQAACFTVVDNSLIVKVSSQVGRMEEIVCGRIEGEAVEVHVNSRFVFDVLKVLDHKEVQIDFHGKNGPLVIRMPGNLTYLYLVLPIKID